MSQEEHISTQLEKLAKVALKAAALLKEPRPNVREKLEKDPLPPAGMVGAVNRSTYSWPYCLRN